jgi:hypothetical protein
MSSAANQKAANNESNDHVYEGLTLTQLEPKHFPRVRHLMYTIEMEDVVNQSLPLSDKLMEKITERFVEYQKKIVACEIYKPENRWWSYLSYTRVFKELYKENLMDKSEYLICLYLFDRNVLFPKHFSQHTLTKPPGSK